MHTVQALSRLVEHNQIYAYLMIFAVTIVEGEVISISAGILVALGALNFWVSLLAIFCGAFLKTFSGYSIGKFLNKKFYHTKFLQYVEKKVLSIMPRFEEKPFWSIFISKFIMMNHVVIIFSGYKKINFRKYLKAEFTSTLIWAPSLLLLGYFFSYAAFRISKRLSEFTLIIVLFIVGFFLVDKLISFLYDAFQNIFYGEE